MSYQESRYLGNIKQASPRQELAGPLTSDSASYNVMLQNQNVSNILVAPQSQGPASQRGNPMSGGKQFAPGSVKNQ